MIVRTRVVVATRRRRETKTEQKRRLGLRALPSRVAHRQACVCMSSSSSSGDAEEEAVNR